jgi:hypothetical protein
MCYLVWEPNEYLNTSTTSEFNDGANFPNTSEGIGTLHSKHGGNALALDAHVDFVTAIKFSATRGAAKPEKTDGAARCSWARLGGR